MYSLLAFFITLTQLIVIITSYFLHSSNILYSALIYGSPLYLLMNLFNSNSFAHGTSIVYLVLLVFHVLKYVIIVQSQVVDGRNTFRNAAIIFEVAYLAMSGYWLNAGLI